jgi:uncharacterized low-complexity protein
LRKSFHITINNRNFKDLIMKYSTAKPLTAIFGAAFVAAMAQIPATQAAENPFATTELQGGYKIAAHHGEGKCGEGKCGEGMKSASEGNCGEGMKKASEGKCGEGMKKASEGSCGEGHKSANEGMCGESKSMKTSGEGKCGEGKCGG